MTRSANRSSPLTPGEFAIFSRAVNHCWKAFVCGLCLLVVAALAAGGYLYLHLDSEIRRQVERLLANHYQHLTVCVGSARFDQDRGITIGDISFRDAKAPAGSPPLLEIGELFLAGVIRVDELLSGSLPVHEVVVRQANLSAVQADDGTWNLSQLLPMPKFSDASPTILIEDANLVVRSGNLANSLSLREIDIKLTPTNATEGEPLAAGRYQISGSLNGLPVRQSRFDGKLGIADGGMDITFGVAGLNITPELLSNLPVQLPAAVRGTQINGLADIGLRLTRSGHGGELGWSAQARIQRGQIHLPSVPQPITEIAMIVQADRTHLAIKELTAKWGASTIVAACNRSGWSADAPVGLSVRLSNLAMARELAALLPAQCAQLWTRFEPVGLVDVDVRATFDGQTWQPKITADCRNLSLTDNEKFPYRVENATGRVEYAAAARGEADRLKLDLTGAGNVQIKAELTHLTTPPPDKRPRRTGVASNDDTAPDGPVRQVTYRGLESPPPTEAVRPHAVGWVEVSGSNASFENQSLRGAIAQKVPQAGRIIDSLRPRGLLDFRWRAEWTDRMQPRADTSLDLTLKDCSMVYEKFPYPLRNVQGKITERRRHWELHDLTARGASGSTTVTCLGEIARTDASQIVQLAIVAGQVPLDAQLLQALPPDCQRAWEEVRPQGHVDLNVLVSHETGSGKPAVDVTIKPSDGAMAIEPRHFPFRFDAVQGMAKFSAGRVEIENFSGRHGSSLYSARQAAWQAEADGAWRFSLAGVNVSRPELNRDLFNALPRGLQQIIARLRPRGAFAIYESSLNVFKRPGIEQLAANWDINLDCHQVTLGDGLPLENLTGGVRFKGETSERGSETLGELAVHSMTFKGMQFTSVRGPLWANREVCLFGQPADAKMRKSQPRPITADAYGGSLTADIRINHETATPTFRAQLALGGAELNRFATERLGGPKDLTGVVSGKLALEGSGNSTQTLLGGGELHVVNAHIYKLPVLVALLKVLKNRSPNSTAFNRCDLQFQVQGERVAFQQIKLLGDAVSLYGFGETGFDRQLNMVFRRWRGPRTCRFRC